jgi:hypothetical protein
MKVFFYVGSCGEDNGGIEKVIAAAARVADVQVYRDLDMLARWFRRPQLSLDQPIVVLVAASRRDLGKIAAMRFFLEHLPIILVLPDRRQKTAALGHTLRPRYVGYRDGDFEDVAAVLGRMLSMMEDAA